MVAPALLLSVLPLLKSAGAASITQTAADVTKQVFEPDKITRTTEDKPGKIQTDDDVVVDSLKKSTSYLAQMYDKGITTTQTPNPAGSKF